jgi:hypothetical protein
MVLRMARRAAKKQKRRQQAQAGKTEKPSHRLADIFLAAPDVNWIDPTAQWRHRFDRRLVTAFSLRAGSFAFAETSYRASLLSRSVTGSAAGSSKLLSGSSVPVFAISWRGGSFASFDLWQCRPKTQLTVAP